MTTSRWAKTDALSFLARGSWFGSLPAPLQNEIVERGEIVQFKANSALYKIGDKVDGLYAALEGDIRAYAYGDEGERIFLRNFGPGTWFGDVHLLDDYPTRTFEAWSTSPSTALFLPADAYHAMTSDNLANYRCFVRLMSIHMRHSVRVFIEARAEAPKRAARALIRLARAHGVPAGDGVKLEMHLSQADLASNVGVSRQYMNELIARWEQDGFLRWNGKAHPLINIERLRTLLSSHDSWIEDSDDWV